MATLNEVAWPEDRRNIAIKLSAALASNEMDVLFDILSHGESASQFKGDLLTAQRDLHRLGMR